MDASQFGNYVSAKRKELGLTQDQLGEMVFVSGKAVSKWERGIGFPDINTLEPLADALNVSLSELMQAGCDPAPGNAEEQSRAIAETAAVAARQLRYYRRSLHRKMLVSVAIFLAVCIFVYFILAMTRTLRSGDPIWGSMHEMLDRESTIDCEIFLSFIPVQTAQEDEPLKIVNEYNVHIDKKKETVQIVSRTFRSMPGGVTYSGERMLFDISIIGNALAIQQAYPEGNTETYLMECDTESFKWLLFDGTYYEMTSQRSQSDWGINKNSSGKYAQNRLLSDRAMEMICIFLGTDKITPVAIHIEADSHNRDDGYYIRIHIDDCTELYLEMYRLLTEVLPDNDCNGIGIGYSVTCDVFYR